MFLKHIEDYHKVEDISSEDNNNLSLVLPSIKSILKVFKSQIWLVDFPSKNTTLNDYFKTYDLIERPIRIIEDSPIPRFIYELWDNVFSKNDLETITKVASWLEKQGNNGQIRKENGHKYASVWYAVCYRGFRTVNSNAYSLLFCLYMFDVDIYIIFVFLFELM